MNEMWANQWLRYFSSGNRHLNYFLGNSETMGAI